MATNDFRPFANDAGANVATLTDYSSNSGYALGYQSGVAQSKFLNRTWRQSSMMASAWGQVIADSGTNAIDDGSVANLAALLRAAIIAVNVGRKAVYSTSGTWVSPVDGTVYVSACAGGSGGSGGGGSVNQVGVGGGGAGGGAGQSIQRQAYTVVKGASYPITIGAGGSGGGAGTPSAAGGAGGAGGNTVFGSFFTLQGASAPTGGLQYAGSVVPSGGGSSATAYPSGSWGADGATGLSGGVGMGGMGGSSPFGGGGGGGRSGSTGVIGYASGGYGSGGGGGGGAYGSTAGGANGGPGGAGTPGIIIIEF